jgi:hypothetical protein
VRTVRTKGCGIALTGVVALLTTTGCARVIGLGSGYYEVSGDDGSTGGESGGVAGSGGTSDGGVGGSEVGGANGTLAGSGGGVPDGPICSEHPITAKSTWVATTSSQFTNNPPSNLIDNTPARWSTGKPQSGDEWLQIDFGETVYIRRVNLQQGMDSNDYPRMYSLYITDADSGATGSTALATGVGSSGVTTTIELSKPVAGRYLLIRQLGSSLSWWSVEELEVSCFDGNLGSVSP